MNEQMTGAYRKYKVERTNGSSEPGGKHENCRYFVLDLCHDPLARHAIEAYVKALRTTGEYPLLADDLQDWLNTGKFLE